MVMDEDTWRSQYGKRAHFTDDLRCYVWNLFFFLISKKKIRLIVTIDDDVKSLREKMIIEQKKLNEVYV